MAEASTGKQTKTTETFRFREKKLGAIAALIGLAGLLLASRIWEAASRMGLLSTEASGEDFSRAQTNLLLVALLLAGIALLTAGTILLFAETKKVDTDVTEPPATGDGISATGVGGAVKFGSMIADGMGKLKGGSVSLFAGVALFVIAAWIATAGVPDDDTDSTQENPPAVRTEAA